MKLKGLESQFAQLNMFNNENREYKRLEKLCELISSTHIATDKAIDACNKHCLCLMDKIGNKKQYLENLNAIIIDIKTSHIICYLIDYGIQLLK